MSLYPVTARNLRPALNPNILFSSNARLKGLKAPRLKGIGTIHRTPAPVKACIPVRPFIGTRILRRLSVSRSSERLHAFTESTTKVPGLELKTKYFGPFLQDWRWYAKTKVPSDEKGVIKDFGSGIARLGAANEDGFLNKTNKSRLEQIKKMLRDKNKLKRGSSPPTSKD